MEKFDKRQERKHETYNYIYIIVNNHFISWIDIMLTDIPTVWFYYENLLFTFLILWKKKKKYIYMYLYECVCVCVCVCGEYLYKIADIW